MLFDTGRSNCLVVLKIILEKDEDELEQLSKGLTKKYSDDISDEVSDQLMLLKLTLRAKLTEIKLEKL